MSASPKRIAIQGVRASFHDVAARRFFGTNVTPVECSSFRLLCESLKTGNADFAVMAIENTIAGSILPNYSLLESYGFKVMGECYLRIEMCLLALPGQTLAEIRSVQSHPMAILQCQEFLSTLPGIRVIEASDTAESAMEIATRKLSAHAAIASRLAGETFGLEILREGIETDPRNFTRFLALCRPEEAVEPADANKATLRFEVGHRPGSLARVLETLGRHEINLTKIQSIPIIGKPYQYGMHVDLEWKQPGRLQAALAAIGSDIQNLVHFGNYRSEEKPS